MTAESFHHATLVETGDGFRYRSIPSLDLLEPSCLTSRDPWTVICAVLENLKRGSFSSLEHITRLLKTTDAADVWDGCEVLLSYAAPHSTVLGLTSEFDNEIYRDGHVGIQTHICTILARSMLLEAIPTILDIYKRIASRDHRMRVEKELSFFLEPDDDVLFNGPRCRLVPEDYGMGDDLPEPFHGEVRREYDDDSYVAAVEQAQSAISTTLQDIETPNVFNGSRFSVRQCAQWLLDRVRAGTHTERVSVARMVFEANTGTDCRGFYIDGALQPLRAAAAVEQYLFDPGAKLAEDGVRYFFGHRIPD